MSLKASLEILVYFQSLRNVDLFHQGIYMIKASVYQQAQDNDVNHSTPYNIIPVRQILPGKKDNKKDKLGKESQIFDTHYYSKPLTIRYQEEVAEINDMCQFRIELDAFPHLNERNFFFQVDLLFADFSMGTAEESSSQESPDHFYKKEYFYQLLNKYAIGNENQVNLDIEKFKLALPAENQELKLKQEAQIQYDQQSTQQSLEEEKCSTDSGNDQRNKFVKFSQQFDFHLSEEQDEAIKAIELEINSMAGFLFQIWDSFVRFLQEYSISVLMDLHTLYDQKMKDRCGESIFRKTIVTTQMGKSEEEKSGKINQNTAKKRRQSQYYQDLKNFEVQDVTLFPSPDVHPIIFEEVFIKEEDDYQHNFNKSSKLNSPFKKNNGQKREIHLFVLCHGYQGNSYDMRIFKDNLSLKYPNSLFMSSSKNEDQTEGDIWEMGKRLAEEIRKYIKDWCPGQKVHKLSFIGHSMGGLIIRSSLPHLEDLKEKFNTFISLSSPHLGFLYHSSKMVDAGLWVMKKFKQTVSLNQMTLTDNKDLENTFIFQLSQKPGLNWFQNIALVSSYQDSYVPWHSARIQHNPKADSSDSSRSKLYKCMVENLLKDLKAKKIHRIDVNFEIIEKNIDSVIGRAAHIQFLENQTVMKMIIHCFEHLFE